MARFTPEEVALKQAERLKASTAYIEAGINKVTEAPGKKAAAKKTKMQTNLNKALDSGKWERRVAAVPLETWKNQAITKGIPRIASGIDGAHDKQVDFYGQLLPAIDAAKAKIAGMPDTTPDDNINRCVSYLREMIKFEKK